MNALFKNKWTWIIAVAILGAGSFIVWSNRTSSAAPVAASSDTAIAFVGDLSENATASGEVVAIQDAGLSLLTAGEVEAVNVEVGDTVAAGDVLVELESVALERSVESAESAVRVAEAELANLMADPSAADLASAEASVASAQAYLNDLLAGPTETEIASSQASLDAAQANIYSASGSLSATYEMSEADVLQAQINLDDALDALQTAEEQWVRMADCEWDDQGNATCEPKDNERMEQATRNVELARADVELARAQLDDAQNPNVNTVASSQASVASSQASYDAALARHEALLSGATAEEIASAEADLVSAQATLDILLAGPLATEIKTYETRLEQAQTDLLAAQNALAEATLVAPFDGVITTVYVAEGEMASGLAVDLVNVSALEVVLNIDEVDIGQIAVGQEAVVSFETWPDAEISSEVSSIAPSAALDSSLINFGVHLTLDESDLPILVGMTANAELITANREDVLLIPNSALTADRDSGTYFVNVIGNEGSVEEIEVTIGLRDDEFTQITGGLDEGAEVLLGTVEAPVEETGFGPGQ
ncbi:MAG: efflux RND transporter periplasmic adaptor subunit [Chloroflexota bacterium]